MPGLRSRTLQMRAGSFAGVFLMILMTAVIAAAAGQIMATGLGAPGSGRFAAADAVVRADPTVKLGHGDNLDKIDVPRSALLPAGDVGRVARIAGVRSAVGDVSFPITVIGRDGVPLPTSGGAPAQAHGWPSAALTPYRVLVGRPPARPDEIVLDQRLAQSGGFRLGDRVRVVSPAGPATVRLVGVVTSSGAQQERRSSVFLTEAQAQSLAGLGPGYNAIAIRFQPGPDQVTLRHRIGQALGGNVQVLDRRHAAAADTGDPTAYDRIQLVAVIASGGGITLAIAIFVLGGTVAYTAERRRRQIAMLRAVGATPGQVRAMLMRETAAIGLLAGAAGCLAATALFGLFARALTAVGLAPDGFVITPSWIPYSIAVGVGVVVAVLATLLAARRALSVRPGEALVESAMPARRLGVVRALLGILALGGGLTLVIALSSSALAFATLAAFAFMIGVALLGPVLIGRPAAFAARALLPAGGAGFLAGSGVRAGRFRVGALGAAVALVVALTGTQALSIATTQRTTQRATAERVRAEYVVVPAAGGGLPPALATAAARLPGVTATGVLSTEVYLLDHALANNSSSWNAAGLDPSSARGTLDLDVQTGSLDAVRGNGVAVSETLARTGGVRVGRVLHARLADATPAELRVVAVYRRSNGLGDIVLPHHLALEHAAAPLDSAVFISGRGAGWARGLRAIVGAVPTAVMQSRTAYLADVKALGQQQSQAQWAIAALMILIAAMAALNTGALAAADRRRELVLARLCGATRGQVIRAWTLDSFLTTVAGIATGAVVVLASLAGAGSDPTGGAIAIPWGQAGLVLGGGLVLGLVGALLPAAVIGRAPLTALAGARE
ncbi:MAG: FtsX-like permease family protein [Solirubrobacterales bacterium]|nr:FtsX-like permease family protein [Solirubrobacterales bacterium]